MTDTERMQLPSHIELKDEDDATFELKDGMRKSFVYKNVRFYDSWFQDALFFIKNYHPFVGLFAAYESHPYRKTDRWLVALAGLLMTYLIIGLVLEPSCCPSTTIATTTEARRLQEQPMWGGFNDDFAFFPEQQQEYYESDEFEREEEEEEEELEEEFEEEEIEEEVEKEVEEAMQRDAMLNKKKKSDNLTKSTDETDKSTDETAAVSSMKSENGDGQCEASCTDGAGKVFSKMYWVAFFISLFMLALEQVVTFYEVSKFWGTCARQMSADGPGKGVLCMYSPDYSVFGRRGILIFGAAVAFISVLATIFVPGTIDNTSTIRIFAIWFGSFLFAIVLIFVYSIFICLIRFQLRSRKSDIEVREAVTPVATPAFGANTKTASYEPMAETPLAVNVPMQQEEEETQIQEV